MLYPRHDDKGNLVSEEQMVSVREHFTQEFRTLFMTGAIQGDTEGHNLLMAMDTFSHEPIKLVITSPGGDLDAAFLYYDTMKLLKSPVYTLGRFCASAAALVLAAGEKRYLLPHARVMLHLPLHFLGGLAGGGYKEGELQIIHKEAMKYKNRMIDILLECGAKKNREEVLEDIENKDFWMDAQEAIAYGLADEIISREVLDEWLV